MNNKLKRDEFVTINNPMVGSDAELLTTDNLAMLVDKINEIVDDINKGEA